MTRTDVEKVVLRCGGKIEGGRSGRSWDYSIDAPRGFVWVATKAHCVVAECYDGPKAWRSAMWKDALERVRMGVEKCQETDCDVCSEE